MNEAKALTLEAGKFYRTRDGKKALVGATNPFSGGSSCNVVGFTDGYGLTTWTPDGCYYADKEMSVRDLVAEWVEPKRIKGWVAVKSSDMEKLTGEKNGNEIAFLSHVYATRGEVENLYLGKADAIIEIDVLEGHGLNGEAA